MSRWAWHLTSLLAAAGCASSAPRTEHTAPAALSPEDRERIDREAQTQLADPGDEVFSVRSSLSGVASWTVYLGDDGITVAGKDAQGKAATAIAWELRADPTARTVACAITPGLGAGCNAVAQAIAHDFTPGAGATSSVKPQDESGSTVQTPNEQCSATLTKVSRMLVDANFDDKDNAVVCNNTVQAGIELPPGVRDDNLFRQGACILSIANVSSSDIVIDPEDRSLAHACCGNDPPNSGGKNVIIGDHPVKLICA